MESSAILDLADVEKRLKINRRTLREYVKQGRLEAKKIGRSYYITEERLMQFVEGR